MTLRWLGDEGPLVLLAAAQASGWEGIWRDATDADPPGEIEEHEGRRVVMDVEIDEHAPRTDYARACARLVPPAMAALVPHRAGVALALETTGHQAAVLPWPEGKLIAKWIYAPSPAHAEAVLALAAGVSAWSDAGVEWEAPQGGAHLHPAASRFEPELALTFELAPGRYAVATALYEPDEDSCFELFALRRSA